jgi:hypothetical protein
VSTSAPVLALSNDVVIADPVATVRAKFRRFAWEWYDGVVSDPTTIEPVDFAITIAMNSRATARRMAEFMARRPALERLLSEVPTDVELTHDTPQRGLDAVAALFAEACAAKGTKLSVASKVLHRKRPALIPILDRVVVDRHYWPALSGDSPPPAFDTSWLKHGAWSDPTQYMRVIGMELNRNREVLSHMRRELDPEVPRSISDVRLLEAALYAHLVGIAPAP